MSERTVAIRFYLDEHVPPMIGEGLRRRGYDVITAAEAELLAEPDERHLDFAASQQRVLVTRDTACLDLIEAGHAHHGMIYYPQQSLPIGRVLRGLTRLCRRRSAEEMRNHIEYL